MDTDYTAQSVLTTVDYNQETAAVFPSKSGYMLYVVWRGWHRGRLKGTSTHPITAVNIACILPCHQNLHFLLY